MKAESYAVGIETWHHVGAVSMIHICSAQSGYHTICVSSTAIQLFLNKYNENMFSMQLLNLNAGDRGCQ